MVRPERTKPPHTLFYGKDAKYTRSLRTFGEMAVIAIHEGKKRSKLDDRGKTCMFVGYADDHTKDVYWFLNIHTKRIILSRDVRWLNTIWKQYKKKSIYARKQVKTFQEAWNCPVENERKSWRAAIRKEIRSMIERGVWRKTDRKKIPNNRRLIGNKWVLKIKRDGTYNARLVALGYSQIPGVDYTDNFAPVAHDVSFRIALARMMVEKLDSLVMDVETAFLYGDIEEEIFMKSPVGMEEIDPGSSSEDCYQLKKGIYGLCQAARQFWKKFVDTIKKESFGFQVCPADPCMLFKENELGICIIIMYVDDMLIIGKKEQIQDFASKIQKEFSVKIQHNLADYLGCEFHMNKERTRGWLG